MLKFKYNGGLKLDNPYPVKKIDLIRIPLPDKVVLPMQQRIGNQAIPIVSVGERVLTGQIIATIDDQRCAPVHASISGTVVAIDEHVYAHKSGLKGLCVTIESDGKDEWIDTSIGCTERYETCTPNTIYNKIRVSGIVGMGGAGFPTHTKVRLAEGCHTLIVNATECEPGITCDAALMEAYPTKVIRGIEVLLHICKAERAIIAIEDDKQDAIAALNKFCNNENITIEVMPTKYTSGAEKLLLKSLLGIEVPTGKFASDVGVLCQNVGTVVAMFDAVVENRPLISRAVTVAGSAVNVVVLINFYRSWSPEIFLYVSRLLVRVATEKVDARLQVRSRPWLRLFVVRIKVFLPPFRDGCLSSQFGNKSAFKIKYLQSLVSPVRNVDITIRIHCYTGGVLKLSITVTETPKSRNITAVRRNGWIRHLAEAGR